MWVQFGIEQMPQHPVRDAAQGIGELLTRLGVVPGASDEIGVLSRSRNILVHKLSRWICDARAAVDRMLLSQTHRRTQVI
jgi:hypothetical protein